jgi:radical SAM protein with 4Fe4S-binding SPASM domain
MRVNPDRVDLVKEIPLDRPLSFIFETTTKCNFSCSFCPSSDLEQTRRVGFARQDMPNEMFKKVVADLKEFPKMPKTITYHNMGEPLMNPNLSSLIRYAVDANIADNHLIRTNGSLLTKSTAKDLVDSGLTQIGISVEAVNEEGYQKYVHRKGMFEKVVQGVTELYDYAKGKCHVFAKIIDFGTPATDIQEFKKIFSPITDECGVEYPRQWNHDLSDTTLGQGVKLTVNGDLIDRNRVTCPFPFYTMVVTSTGKCLMCCFDWSSQTIVGDVNLHSVKNIWHSKEVKDFWLMQLKGERYKNSACKNCLDIFTPIDNLDKDQKDLIERLEKNRGQRCR